MGPVYHKQNKTRRPHLSVGDIVSPLQVRQILQLSLLLPLVESLIEHGFFLGCYEFPVESVGCADDVCFGSVVLIGTGTFSGIGVGYSKGFIPVCDAAGRKNFVREETICIGFFDDLFRQIKTGPKQLHELLPDFFFGVDMWS